MVGSGTDISKQKVPLPGVVSLCSCSIKAPFFLNYFILLCYQKPKIQDTVFSGFPASANRLSYRVGRGECAITCEWLSWKNKTISIFHLWMENDMGTCDRCWWGRGMPNIHVYVRMYLLYFSKHQNTNWFTCTFILNIFLNISFKLWLNLSTDKF